MSLIDDREHIIRALDGKRDKSRILDDENLVLGIRNNSGLEDRSI